MSKRVEEYIKNYTRNYSNVILIPLKLKDNKGCYTESYNPWLTPDQARKAVEIAREEVIKKAVKWLEGNAVSYLDKCDNPTYMGGYFIKTKELAEDFRKYMEENV